MIFKPGDILRTHYYKWDGKYHFEYSERINSMYETDVPMTTGGGSLVQLTVQERLESEKLQLEARLKQVTEALEALNKNPEIQEVINKISAITHF